MHDKMLLVVGLAVSVAAAVLMISGTLSLPWGLVVGVIGLGLLSAVAARRT